jgi:UDPglucose 6-dehydrogenase
MTITFIGHGYVGLVSAAVFADLGNTVWVIGHTPEKIEGLKKGVVPIYEPGLSELVKRNVDAGRLLFTLEYDRAIPVSDVVFIAVGTPPLPTGEADLSVVFSVAETLAPYLSNYTVVNVKSTVPIGTNRKVKEILDRNKPANAEVSIASVPEFLREGQAISDTLNPDRIVIGTDDDRARDVLLSLHAPIHSTVITTTLESAEMIKYAANSFLAMKISFANSIAMLSEKLGAHGPEVLRAVGLDKRIGQYFLNAGAGFGGSCFPKDVKALMAIAKEHRYDFPLLEATFFANQQAMQSIVEKTESAVNGDLSGKTVAVWGVAFKPDTDDMRDAPSLVILPKLIQKGAKIRAYDPVAISHAKRLMPDIESASSALDAVQDADVLLVLTEWNEFKDIDLTSVASIMKSPVIVDGRNCLPALHAKELGFRYTGVGQ